MFVPALVPDQKVMDICGVMLGTLGLKSVRVPAMSVPVPVAAAVLVPNPVPAMFAPALVPVKNAAKSRIMLKTHIINPPAPQMSEETPKIPPN